MMPTEAMRLDAEEEAARGAVEHLLKTLERDPSAPGKVPAAQEAPPAQPKELANGKDAASCLKEAKMEEEQNGSHCDEPSTNGTCSPSPQPPLSLQNGSELHEQKEEQKIKTASEEKVENSLEVSSVLSGVLDVVENNVDSSGVSPDVSQDEEEESCDSKEGCQKSEETEPTSEEVADAIADVVQQVVDDLVAAKDKIKEEPTEVSEKEEQIGDTDTEGEKEAAALPVESAAVGKKSKGKEAKKVEKTPSSDNVDSAVSNCVSNMCDVLDSVDNVVSEVEKAGVVLKSKKAKPDKTAAVVEKKDSPKSDKNKSSAAEKKVSVVAEKKVMIEKIEKKGSSPPKKREKLPPKVPLPAPAAAAPPPPPPEKAKRKPRKKKQQPLVAPVLPFPTYYPALMAPPTNMSHHYNFPAPIPVDLSVAKKKVQKVAPIPSMLPPMQTVASTSLPDQVLDLSVKRGGRPPSEKKVKPIKRLSKKALQSVFHHFAPPADLLRMTPPQMMPPPPAPAAASQEPSRNKCRKGVQSMPPPPSVTPFVFQIESHHVGLAPNGTKVYDCDVCSGSYQRQFSLKRHYLRTHVNARLVSERDVANCGIVVCSDTPPNTTDLYRCHLCTTLFFSRREQLVAHLSMHPEEQGNLVPFASSPGPPSQVLSCEICSTTFTSRVNLLKHQALHQTQEFPCFYCYRVFNSTSAREKHHVQHTTNDNQHPCMFLCGKTLRTLPELRAHLQMLHNKEYFGCPRCNERFVDSARLELHLRTVHSGPVHEPPIISITPIIDEPPPMLPPPKQPAPTPEEPSAIKYSCSMCSETFPSYVSMCKHRKTHGTVGKHTKAAPSSPQKMSKESPPPPPPPAPVPKSSATVTVYLESREEHEAAKKQVGEEKFSLPNLSAGKQTVALTSEVTISALPPDESEQEAAPVFEESKPADPTPEPSRHTAEPERESPEPMLELPVVVEKKKPELKLKVKLNFGKKGAKSKKKGGAKKKELPKRAVAGKNVAVPVAVKTVAVQEEAEVVQENEVEVPVEKAASKEPPKVEEKKESAKIVPEIKIEPAPKRTPVEEEGSPTPRHHPKKFLGRNREKSPQNAEDMSHLCLSTQHTVKRRATTSKRKQTQSGKKNPRKSSSRPTRNNPHTSENRVSFMDGLDLVQTNYQMPVEKNFRRSKKLIEEEMVVEELVEEGFTGDWIRPKRYICHICRGKFPELWDLDDHVNEVHTNVWCTYMDIDATLTFPDDIFQRSIQANGALSNAEVHPLTDPTTSHCTKCGKNHQTLADLHRHMLECGGDTTWMLISPRKRKQWRPFGTRRRARRGMKRIPSSPVKLNRPRKPDGDSIQKMIANLPSKRGSRRVINFNEDEIKTRSQATIHSQLRPAGTSGSPSKGRPAKHQVPKGRSTTMALSERRASAESTKTADKPNKQTAKTLPEESKVAAPANSQAPIIVKLKKKKVAKKVDPTPEVEEAPVPVAAASAPPVEPSPAAPAAEPAPKILNKYVPVNCHFCDKGLINYFSLLRHLKCCPKNPKKSEEKEPEAPKESFEVVNSCPLCNEVFTSNKLLERHASNCCESPTEIGYRKKLFRRRPSEVSVSSKKSEADSVKSSVPESADPNRFKRRKRGKGRPFFIRKNATKKFIFKPKVPLALQRLSKKVGEQEHDEESLESAKRRKATRKSELEKLVLPSTGENVVELEDKSKKHSSKKAGKKGGKKVLERAEVAVEPESIEALLGHLETKPQVMSETASCSAEVLSHFDETVESVVKQGPEDKTVPGEGKKKKKKSKSSKKQSKILSSELVESDDKLGKDKKKPKLEEELEPSGISLEPEKSKKGDKKGSKKKQLDKNLQEQPQEAPVTVEPVVENHVSKSKKKDVKDKEKKGKNSKGEDEEEVPLSQIIKKSKKKSDFSGEQQWEEVVSSAEPSLSENPSKKGKKSADRNNGEDEPLKKKVKSTTPSKKRPVEETAPSSEEPSPKKKRGRKSDEKSEPVSTYCKTCDSGFSTAFNYHKHLKSMKHLNKVQASGGGGVQDLKEPSPELTVPEAVMELSQKEEEVEEEGDEIVFPFIKEGTPPVCPPPPPPSPCSPLDAEEKPVEVVDAKKLAELEDDDMEQQEDGEEEDEWLRPTPLPPQPKWDFDAVRDSVPDWTSKPIATPTYQPPAPPPVIEENKNYDDVLGGIVNQLISHSEYQEGQPAGPTATPSTQQQEEVQDTPTPSNPYLMTNYEGQQSLDEIQSAMGATDEEMAMLENLGGGSSLAFVYDNSGSAEYDEAHPGCSATLVNLANTTGPIEPLENADLMDLDNQTSGQEAVMDVPRIEELQTMSAKYAAKPSLPLESGPDVSSDDEVGQSGVPSNSKALLSMYEQKEMVCPMCNKHFLGLQALEAHISWAHKVKETKAKIVTDIKGASKTTDQVARDRDCLLVGLAAANMLHHAGGIRGGVLRAAAGAVADECAQKKRKIACFVCKELYTDMVALNAHIRKQHVKCKTETPTTKENGLKQQMTTALGGLLDRALSSMLGKVPLPADKPSGDNESSEDTGSRNWEDSSGKSLLNCHVNMEPPLTLTAIAKKAIQPVTAAEKANFYESMEPEQSKTESVISKRKKSIAKDTLKPEEPERPPPLFPENQLTPSTFDPILPEPQGVDMHCPICLGAVKHFHSLCRHLKTQHTEWAMNTFNTDLFHYLILKRDNPPITINKKYSIYIPMNRASQPAEQQASGSGVQSVAAEEEAPSESTVEEDDIRQKVYAALQQLSTTKPVRGSKRRPVNFQDLS